MRSTILSALLFFCMLFFSCTTKPDLESLQSELIQADRDWAAAAKMGEIAKLTSYWADDAINFFPGTSPAIGKEAIQKLVKRNRMQTGFSLSWEPSKAVVASSGDLGYTYGTFKLSFKDSLSATIQKNGSYVCIWQKAAGATWKCTIESTIFSSK